MIDDFNSSLSLTVRGEARLKNPHQTVVVPLMKKADRTPHTKKERTRATGRDAPMAHPQPRVAGTTQFHQSPSPRSVVSSSSSALRRMRPMTLIACHVTDEQKQSNTAAADTAAVVVQEGHLPGGGRRQEGKIRYRHDFRADDPSSLSFYTAAMIIRGMLEPISQCWGRKVPIACRSFFKKIKRIAVVMRRASEAQRKLIRNILIWWVAQEKVMQQQHEQARIHRLRSTTSTSGAGGGGSRLLSKILGAAAAADMEEYHRCHVPKATKEFLIRQWIFQKRDTYRRTFDSWQSEYRRKMTEYKRLKTAVMEQEQRVKRFQQQEHTTMNKDGQVSLQGSDDYDHDNDGNGRNAEILSPTWGVGMISPADLHREILMLLTQRPAFQIVIPPPAVSQTEHITVASETSSSSLSSTLSCTRRRGNKTKKEIFEDMDDTGNGGTFRGSSMRLISSVSTLKKSDSHSNIDGVGTFVISLSQLLSQLKRYESRQNAISTKAYVAAYTKTFEEERRKHRELLELYEKQRLDDWKISLKVKRRHRAEQQHLDESKQHDIALRKQERVARWRQQAAESVLRHRNRKGLCGGQQLSGSGGEQNVNATDGIESRIQFKPRYNDLTHKQRVTMQLQQLQHSGSSSRPRPQTAMGIPRAAAAAAVESAQKTALLTHGSKPASKMASTHLPRVREDNNTHVNHPIHVKNLRPSFLSQQAKTSVEHDPMYQLLYVALSET